MCPACWGLGAGGKCCVAPRSPVPAQMLCAGFPGQRTPPGSFGPNWSHKPSASWGKRVRVCSAAQQDVANPELYFFICHCLSFVFLNTTWQRLLVHSSNDALLCSVLLGVLSVTLKKRNYLILNPCTPG